MEYCGPIGLPHSRFLSWDPVDQDKAIAWALHKGQQCKQCGTFPDEWLDEKGMPVDPPPYMAGSEICLGCAELDAKRKELPDGRETQYRLHLRPWRPQEPDSEVERPELD
jgi:hypothetical protein